MILLPKLSQVHLLLFHLLFHRILVGICSTYKISNYFYLLNKNVKKTFTWPWLLDLCCYCSKDSYQWIKYWWVSIFRRNYLFYGRGVSKAVFLCRHFRHSLGSPCFLVNLCVNIDICFRNCSILYRSIFYRAWFYSCCVSGSFLSTNGYHGQRNTIKSNY